MTVKSGFFYADDVVVASTDLVWIQSAFYLMMGMFDRVVLLTNVRKTVVMVFRPCRAARVQAYKS